LHASHPAVIEVEGELLILNGAADLVKASAHIVIRSEGSFRESGFRGSVRFSLISTINSFYAIFAFILPGTVSNRHI